MKRLIFSAVVLLMPFFLFADNVNDVKSPVEPTINDTVFPEMQQPSVSTNGPEPLYILKAGIVYADGLAWKGTVFLTNNAVITITNKTQFGMDVKVLSMYNIESIRVVRWTAERKNGEDQYHFTPAEYRIVAVGTDTNGLVYTGNIPVLNQFVFSDDRSKKVVYTIFFDNWVQGKKGVFRWENSRANSFPYNFTNPLPGVVVEIDFDRNF